MISFRMLTHFKIKLNFKFQIFKFFTESLLNKGQYKTNRERNDENKRLRGNFVQY